MNADTGLLEKTICYSFKDKGLLEQALSHPSYSAEAGLPRYKSNQRLEFLGDAVLELVISDYLYREHREAEEGRLTRQRQSLVFEAALAVCAERIGLGRFIRLGVGEAASRGYEKPSILSDTFEAVIGAVYLDGGYEAAKSFVHSFVTDSIDELTLLNDGKSLIQQYVQNKPGNTLSYNTDYVDKNDRERGFKADLLINDEVVSTGFGRSKKTAEQDAAGMACRKLNIR
jgi:ribonuclease-3